MSFQRIAVIFDRELRPETTGTYCLRALGRLVARAEHVSPTDVERLQPGQYDLYLNIDDGLQYRLPPHLRPSAWWVIDTHLAPEWAEKKGQDFEWIFAAQRDGVRRLTVAGLPATWLPLACDPEIHRPHSVPKRFDVGFVGRIAPGARQDLLELIARNVPNTFIGQRYFEEYAKTLSESRVGFNRLGGPGCRLRLPGRRSRKRLPARAAVMGFLGAFRRAWVQSAIRARRRRARKAELCGGD